MITPASAEGPAGRWKPSLGAWPEAGGTRFRVWAPAARSVSVLVDSQRLGNVAALLQRQEDGAFTGHLDGIQAGDRYTYRPDDLGPFPDPASRFQPEGVHGPSLIVDPGSFRWTDSSWRGRSPDELVLYELHVGTFTPAGTFAGAAERLADLAELGVNAIELMPVADFAGSRSWGYDGVDLFAPSRCYGTPDNLRRLVDHAHALGLAVFLDVVYNHFGPVGNYAPAFSPDYLSKTHQSAWAACVNLDGPDSARVREFFIENALHWVHEYHIDGLRLDATHELHDDSPMHFVAELAARVRAPVPGRRILIVAEDHRNDARMVRPPSANGWDLDGVWADDFHHEVRRLLAGDNEGYYRDYSGTVPDIVATVNQGWFYTGQYSIHRDEMRGTDPHEVPPRRFVICLQNHDQIGNRAFGGRLSQEIDAAAFRAASALLLTAPQTPLLFMGQEWAASAPFLYFTDHDEDLGKIVTEGRRREFRHFVAFVDPEARERIPDPQQVSTFERSRLDWNERKREPHASVRRLYQALLALRRSEPALQSARREDSRALVLDDDTLVLRRNAAGGELLLVVVRLRGAGEVNLSACSELELNPEAGWAVVLSTEDLAFADEPLPPRIDLSGRAPRIAFSRPGAIVLRGSASRDDRS